MNSTSNYSYLTNTGKRITSQSFLGAGLSRVDLCHSDFIVVWFITISDVAKANQVKLRPSQIPAVPCHLDYKKIEIL